MSRLLSDSERAVLLQAYKDDRLRDAPANILDKTLIENYGTDEQKKLLPEVETPKAQEKQEGKGTGAGENAGNANQSGSETDETGKVIETEQENGQNSDEIIPTVENSPELKNEEISASSAEKTAFLDAFNEYVRVFGGKSPAPELSTEGILAAVKGEIERQKTEAKAVAEIPDGSESPANEVKGVEKIWIKNKNTGDERLISKYTFENFMRNDSEWVAFSVPNEVKNL